MSGRSLCESVTSNWYKVMRVGQERNGSEGKSRVEAKGEGG